MLNSQSARLMSSPHRVALHGAYPSALFHQMRVSPRSNGAPDHTQPTFARALPRITMSDAQAQALSKAQSCTRSRKDYMQLSYSSHQVQRLYQAPDSCRDLNALLGYVEELFHGEGEVSTGEVDMDMGALVDEFVKIVEHPRSQLDDELMYTVYKLTDALETWMSSEDHLLDQVEDAWEVLEMIEELAMFEADEEMLSELYGWSGQLDGDQAMNLAQYVTFEVHVSLEMYAQAQTPQSPNRVRQLLSP